MDYIFWFIQRKSQIYRKSGKIFSFPNFLRDNGSLYLLGPCAVQQSDPQLLLIQVTTLTCTEQ